MRLKIHRVHAIEGCGKQGRLFPARAAADLHDHILAVIRVLGKQQKLDLLGQLRKCLFRFMQLLHCQIVQFSVSAFSDQFLRLPLCLLRLHKRAVFFNKWQKLAILPHQRSVQIFVRRHSRIAQACI